MPAARTPSETRVDRSEGVSPPSRSWVRTSGGNGRPRKNCFRRNSTLPYRGEGAKRLTARAAALCTHRGSPCTHRAPRSARNVGYPQKSSSRIVERGGCRSEEHTSELQSLAYLV